jgi:hypothetical protein
MDVRPPIDTVSKITRQVAIQLRTDTMSAKMEFQGRREVGRANGYGAPDLLPGQNSQTISSTFALTT